MCLQGLKVNRSPHKLVSREGNSQVLCVSCVSLGAESHCTAWSGEKCPGGGGEEDHL